MLSYFGVGVSRDDAMDIPLCYSGLVGLDMRDETALAIWGEWKYTLSNGLWHGSHFNNPSAAMLPHGEKFRGHVSHDPRVEGHRHDEAALSLVLHRLGLTPMTLGFLTLESEQGFIGHNVKLVVPGGR
jgi:hypothetical protein